MRPCRREIRAQTSRPLDRPLQGRLAIEAEGDVEALDPLSRCALDQVVERRRHHRLAVLSRYVYKAEVGVARKLGRRALRNHPCERLACVELAVSILERLVRSVEVEVAR